MNKPAPVSMSPARLPACYSTAGQGVLLLAFDLNLEAALAAVIRAAVARSADAASAAASLGVSVRELHRVAARHGVRLPWRASAKRKGARR